MARIRTVKPLYFALPSTGALSHSARLLDIGITTQADDEGLLLWSPADLRAKLFCWDELATLDRMAAWMQELVDAGTVYVYTSTRVSHPIAFIVNFRKGPLAQRPDRPSGASLPVPNWRDPAVAFIYARRDGYLCGTCGEPVNERLTAEQDLTGRNPVCERIKPPSPAFAGADDPTNIRTVHAMCARDTGPGGPGTYPAAFPTVFGADSTNARRTLDESPRARSGSRTRRGQATTTPAPARPAPAAEPTRRTFDERSTNDAEVWTGGDPAEPEALFPLEPAARGSRKRAAAPKSAQDQARVELAQTLTDTWWNALEPKPAGRNQFIATRKIIESLLVVGHTPEAVAAAAERCGIALTLAAMQLHLRRMTEDAARARPAPGPSGVTDLARFRASHPGQSTTERKVAALHDAVEVAKARLFGGA